MMILLDAVPFSFFLLHLSLYILCPFMSIFAIL